VTDLVVATPVFLDLTFVGLEGVPELGEERFAGDLLRSPGGGAITAVAAARLGLSVAVAAPLGEDVAGDLVRTALAEEGVEPIATRPAPRTPTTVVLPVGGDRAMITVDPGARASVADVAARPARAVAASLDQLHVFPPDALAYASCGEDDARAYRGRPPRALEGVRAFLVSEREAMTLTGAATVEDAARTLAELAETVVVLLAPDRALAVSGGELLTADAQPIERLVDTTGASDLLVAAYIWADLRGADPPDRLRWAVLYASLAANAPTGIGGAVDERGLIEAGAAHGLDAPPLARAGRV
jgi:ribokinase